MSGPRSAPPELNGFSHVSWLGGGGFADVFLYQQQRPRRRVAIKVLRKPVTDAATQRQFDAEADLMASVSNHPYIVAVFSADIAPDGRPYLVMEYYPNKHYGVRARERPLSVAEALKVGVQISSAVHRAHAEGIVHRDIKPSNILSSEFNQPGLTDFGISVAQAATEDAAQGLSVLYAPPEIIEEQHAGDERSDVYSLGATVYTLLAGRSPFETGVRDEVHTIMQRVLREPVPAINRPDVPQSLEYLLRQAMAKLAGERPQTALAFARALRDIEQELRLQPTTIELAGAGEEAPPIVTDDEDRTRFGAVQVVSPVRPAEPTPVRLVTPPIVDETRFVEGAQRTLQRPSQPLQPARTSEEAAADPPLRRGGLLIGAGALLAVVVAVGVGASLGEGDGGSTSSTFASTPPQDAILTADVVDNLTAKVEGSALTLEWRNPESTNARLQVWASGSDSLAEEVVGECAAIDLKCTVELEPDFGEPTLVRLGLANSDSDAAVVATIEIGGQA